MRLQRLTFDGFNESQWERVMALRSAGSISALSFLLSGWTTSDALKDLIHVEGNEIETDFERRRVDIWIGGRP